MPALIAMLWGALLNILGTIVGRVLVSLGMTAVTVTGINAAMDYGKAQLTAAVSGLDPEVLGLLGALGAGNFVSIILSAIIARMTIKGITGNSFKKLVRK